MATRGDIPKPALLVEPEPRELAAVFAALRRHLRLSVAIVLGALTLAVVALLLPKLYTADATLAYEPQLPLIKGGGALAMTDAQRDAEIDAQLAQVASLPVAQDVARSVDLAANPRLRQEADTWAAGSDRRLGRDEALGMALLDHVKARRVGQTPTFTISFTAGSAAQAARIANGFAASYLKLAVAQKAALADAGARQIAARVAQLRQQAIAADADLSAFRLSNRLLDNPDSIALEQEVATLRGQLADAQGQAALAGTRTAAEGTTVVGGGTGGSVDTTPVSALTGQRAMIAADLAALLARYGEKHPDVIAARERLAQLDVQLAEAMRGNRASAAVEARAAAARGRALTGSLEDAEARLAATLSHDARLLDLQNSAVAVRQAYQDALKVSADQIAQRALIQPDAQVIALAVPPLRPKFPRLGINLLAGLGLGLGLAAAVAFIRESWFHTLGSVDDIERWLEADYFAPLPRLAPMRTGIWRRPGTRDPAEAVLLYPACAFAESCRSLGTAALFAARTQEAGGGCVIAIASALRQEGRTTTAIAMGRVLAAAGMKVALLAAAPRGGCRGYGARTSDSSGLALFAGDTGPAATPDAGGLGQMMAALRRDYQLVIIDTAPILAGGDDRQLLQAIDGLVLLARWRATPIRTIREAMRRIAAAGGQVSGVALTMVE